MNIIIKSFIGIALAIALSVILFLLNFYLDNEILEYSSYTLDKKLENPSCNPQYKMCDFLSYRDIVDVFHKTDAGKGTVIFFKKTSRLKSALDAQNIKMISIWLPDTPKPEIHSYKFGIQKNIIGIYTENGSTINDYCFGKLTDGTLIVENKEGVLYLDLIASLEIKPWHQSNRKCSNQNIGIKFKAHPASDFL